MKAAHFNFRKASQLTGLVLLLLLSSTAGLRAQDSTDLSEILPVLEQPPTVVLESGNRQTGRVTDWDGVTLRIEVSLGGGVAELSFPKSEIDRIIFPGNEFLETLYEWSQDPSHRTEDTMALFRAYYQQRGAYFSLMDERELSLFVSYAEYALEKDKPLRAVAMIDAISPYIEDNAVLDRLEEGLLLGFFQGGMREEAEAKARAWIDKATPAGSSALGWRLLAELNFEKEDYEKAFWTALYPVAFSNQMPMAHLDICYALAILSAEELRLKDEPARLAREMRSRGFDWPEHVEILKGKAPEAFTAEPQIKATDAESLFEEESLQTASPVDPVESLPTRINF